MKKKKSGGCSFFAERVNSKLLSIGMGDITIHSFPDNWKEEKIIEIFENDFRRKNRPISKEEKEEFLNKMGVNILKLYGDTSNFYNDTDSIKED